MEFAAIIGTNDGSIWANTDTRLLAEEGQKIACAFKDNCEGLKAGGIRIGNTKYMFLRQDGDAIYGKMGGTNGITICKGPQCILVGTYDQRLQPGQASNIVHKMSDYLKNLGY